MRYPDYGLGNMKVEEIATIEKSDEDKKPGWEFRQQFTYGNAREIYIFQEMQRLCRMINVKM